MASKKRHEPDTDVPSKRAKTEVSGPCGLAPTGDLADAFEKQWKAVLQEAFHKARRQGGQFNVYDLFWPLFRQTLQKVAERRVLPTFKALEAKLYTSAVPAAVLEEYNLRSVQLAQMLDPAMPPIQGLEFGGMAGTGWPQPRDILRVQKGDHYQSWLHGSVNPNRVKDTWMKGIHDRVAQLDVFFCRLLAHLHT